MEITGLTFITLLLLMFFGFWFVGWLLKTLGDHDKVKYSVLNQPLKNKGKPWYNKQLYPGRPGVLLKK